MARAEISSPMQSPSNASRLVRRSSPRNGTNVKGSNPQSSGGSRAAANSSAGQTGDEDGDDNGDEAEHEDDDAKEPAAFAPSYGRSKHRNGDHKAGLNTINNKKKQHLVGKTGAGNDQAGFGSDFGETSSVSSVSDPEADSNADDEEEDDDDAYRGVDDVSDEDDADVEKEEEVWILESEYERELEIHAANMRASDQWMGLDDLENRPFYSASSFFEHDQPLLPSEDGDGDFVGAGDDGPASETIETPAPRRVHFDMSPGYSSSSSSSSSSDSEKSTDDEYPDFLQQDSLDPDIRRMIENDNEPRMRPRNRSPHDLFVGADIYDVPGNIYHVESETSVGSSSEYETEGETTDEEDHPPPATITHPRSILRRESSASLTPEREVPGQSSHPLRRRGPLRGTFIADPHKPVAVMAPNGKHLILIPPYASSRHEWLESVTANSLAPSTDVSPRNSISMTNNPLDDSETDAVVSPTRRDSTPMLGSGVNLMMSALQTNSGGQVMGPPEAFYPSSQPGINSDAIGAAFEDDDDDGDSEDMLNVDDFVDFGDGSSDDEEEDEGEETDIGHAVEESMGLTSPVVSSSLPASSLAGTPNNNNNNSRLGPDTTPQANNAERLLNHLDRGIVTAFRRNHNRYQTLIKLPQHREFMPANSPSRPASAFRRSKLTDQKTPTRKRQASSYLGGETVRRKLSDSRRMSASALQ